MIIHQLKFYLFLEYLKLYLLSLYYRLMIFDQNQASLNAWKTEMHNYEKAKRTKKPFAQTSYKVEHITHQKMKTNENNYNPILQTFAKERDQKRANQTAEQKRAKSLANHIRQTIKHEKDYDIVNLHSNYAHVESKVNRQLGPIRNAYNVINNQKIPDFYFQNREVKLPMERTKKLLNEQNRQYDIISSEYREDNQRRMQQEIKRQRDEAHTKYWQTHNFDPVTGKFYDESKEEQKKRQELTIQQLHAQQADKKLPPSYVYRQPLILDYSKPLSEPMKLLDERNNNTKKRFQTNYIALDEYKKRNVEQDEKHQQVLKNHIHFGRILDEKSKQFNIITNVPYKQTRAEELFGKKLQVESWDKQLKEASKTQTRSFIKTGGFTLNS